MDKNRNSGTNGMGGLNPDWRPSTIGALSRALSSGWQSPAMRAEENAENSRMMPSALGIRNVVSPGASAASDTPEEWRFGQPSDLRKLVQRLQGLETTKVSSKQKMFPLVPAEQNSTGKLCNELKASDIEQFESSKHYNKMSANLLKVVDIYRNLKAAYKNQPANILKGLLSKPASYLPKKMIEATWEFASDVNSKQNVAMLEEDYETWRSTGFSKYCAFDHIPWKIFENYDKRVKNMSTKDKLMDWMRDRPQLWAYATLRRGDWSKEDIALLKEIIDFSIGSAI